MQRVDFTRPVVVPVTLSLAAVLLVVRAPFDFVLPLLRWCAEAFGAGV